MAFLGAMSPLLLIPALEPYLAFTLQGAIVATGVACIPWEDARGSVVSTNSYRNKLGTILLTIVPLSVLTAVTVSLPPLNPDAWQSILCTGLAAGLASLTGWWMGTRIVRSWWIRNGLGVAIWVSLASMAARCDWFVTCIDNLAEWPPDESATDWGFYGVYGKGDNINIWYLILGLQILFTNYLTRKSKVMIASVRSRKWPRCGKLATANFLFLAVIVISPSLVVGYKFLTRYSLPAITTPQPNGYEDFLAARDLMPKTRLVDHETFHLWEANEAELREASNELDAALTRIEQGLMKPASVCVDYFDTEYPDDILDDFRSLRWGLCAQGRIALCEGDMESAANRFLDLVAFASASSRGGLMWHDQNSYYAADLGFRGFYQCINQLPRQRIPEYIDRLQRLESEYEPAKNFVRRTDIWMQRSRGWYGHLMSIFGQRFHPRLFEVESYLMDRQHISTIFRLLQTELAIRAYEADHHDWPAGLANLVPEYLPKLLTDPHSANGDHLRYVCDRNSYILYSVGPDGVDNQGERAWQSLSYAVHGDTSLSDQYGEANGSEQ